MKQFERTIGLIGQEGFEKLQKSHILVVGVGGVGSPCVESLVRSGVGHISIVDNDMVEESNLNRQIQATHNTLHSLKVEALQERMLTINPNLDIKAYNIFLDESNVKEIIKDIDYVIDAIDSVKSKVSLYEYCQKNNINIISCLGMAKRLDPTQLTITKLKKTENDPLAKSMRHLVREKGLSLDIDVVISKETPLETVGLGSMMMVPAAAGLTMAYFVIDKLIKME